MTREFVYTSIYIKDCERLEISDEMNMAIENLLLSNPQAGNVIPGLNGARKLRVSLKGKGKRGGGRLIYLNVLRAERIYLLRAYSKNEQADLSSEEKKELAKIIGKIKEG